MRKSFIPLMGALVIAVSSCTLTMGSPATFDTSDLSEFQGKYMTTFDILNNSFTQSGKGFSPFNTPVSAPSSRATVPVSNTLKPDLPGSGETTTGSQAEYPEPGQSSSWTIEPHATLANAYLVKVTTTFPDYDPRLRQEEWYYLKDNQDGDPPAYGTWTTADEICDDAGIVAPAEREWNRLYYRDGSHQDESIVYVHRDWAITDPDGFAAFDINGSLDYPATFVPTTDVDAASWSSVVTYTRVYADSPSFSFWSGNRVRAIVGVRFYTEHDLAGHKVGSTLVFEKAATTLNSLSGDFLDASSALYLPDLATSPDQAYLALTVIRQTVDYLLNDDDTVNYDSAVRDTRAKTRVINIATQQDNYVTLINEEAADITNALTTLWIPIGNDSSIINLSEATTVVDKSTMQTVSTSDSTPLDVFNDAVYGIIGELYNAVDAGTITTDITTDIPGDILVVTSHNGIATYNGRQGTLLNDSTFGFPRENGTVQAWVNVDKTTSYPGIVHAGIRYDFMDEIWTLQLLDNNIPGFALAGQSPYEYDLVQSSERLNLDTWYYLTATWDLATNNLSIYVNGVLRGSARFTKVVAADLLTTESPVVVGSQFYDGTTVLKGYYGLDGQINGVLIDSRVWSAAEIKAFYDANKDKTANW